MSQLQLLKNMANRECKFIIQNPNAGKIGVALKNLRQEVLESVLKDYYGKCLKHFLKTYKSWKESIQSLLAQGYVDDRQGWRFPRRNHHSHILWDLDEIAYHPVPNAPKADSLTELRGDQTSLIGRHLVHQPGREEILKQQLSDLRDFAASEECRTTNQRAHALPNRGSTPSNKGSFITQASSLTHFEDRPVINFLPPPHIMHTLILDACMR